MLSENKNINGQYSWIYEYAYKNDHVEIRRNDMKMVYKC